MQTPTLLSLIISSTWYYCVFGSWMTLVFSLFEAVALLYMPQIKARYRMFWSSVAVVVLVAWRAVLEDSNFITNKQTLSFILCCLYWTSHHPVNSQWFEFFFSDSNKIWNEFLPVVWFGLVHFILFSQNLRKSRYNPNSLTLAGPIPTNWGLYLFHDGRVEWMKGCPSL